VTDYWYQLAASALLCMFRLRVDFLTPGICMVYVQISWRLSDEPVKEDEDEELKDPVRANDGAGVAVCGCVAKTTPEQTFWVVQRRWQTGPSTCHLCRRHGVR
jgi:hypothetical protein